MKKFAHKDVWTSNLDAILAIEIVHWGVDREDTTFEPLNGGKGIWNYYITVFESLVPLELFNSLWLDNESNYDLAPFSQVEWHGGVTSYKKLSQTPGCRSVKIGCDYSHLFDEERGYDYTLEEVTADALETARQLKELYKL